MQTQQHSATTDLTTLKSLIAANPNRGKGLDRLLKQAREPSPPQLSVDLPGAAATWTEYDVMPAGALSALQFIVNPLYGPATAAMRSQMLLEAQTAATEKVDRECRAGGAGKYARQRKKILEWLAADPATLDEAARTTLWDAIATVFEFQAVTLKELPGGATEVGFAPARIDMWHSDRPIYFVEKALSKVWVYGERGLHAALGPWLTSKELGGAAIAWPLAEGTKTELVERLQALPTWRTDYAKKLKDELAEMAGRAAAVSLLGRWMSGGAVSLEDF